MARGGARQGAGRKPASGPAFPFTPVKDRKLEAELALAFFVDAMRNRDLPILVRLNAAREVLDRVEGKPAQSVTVKDWRSEIIELIKSGKVTRQLANEYYGSDLATELFVAAGMNVSTSGD